MLLSLVVEEAFGRLDLIDTLRAEAQLELPKPPLIKCSRQMTKSPIPAI